MQFSWEIKRSYYDKTNNHVLGEEQFNENISVTKYETIKLTDKWIEELNEYLDSVNLLFKDTIYDYFREKHSDKIIMAS